MNLLGSKRLRHQWLGLSIFLIAASVVLQELVTIPLKQFSVVNVSVPRPPDWFGDWQPIKANAEQVESGGVSEKIGSDQMEIYSRGELQLTQDSPAVSKKITLPSANPSSEPTEETGSVEIGKANHLLMPGWLLQAASFKQVENAETLRQALLEQGFRAFIQEEVLGNQRFSRVYVGPELRREDSETQQSQLKERFSLDAVLKPYVPSLLK